jgi:hypothetical protein
MHRLRLFVAVVPVLVMMALGATAAYAGERTGNNEPTQGPAHANSPCVYSGLEDEPFQPGTTQSWGQIVSAAGGHLGGANSQFVPEVGGLWGCNAHLYPLKK